MVVKVYISGISGNKEVKKRQQRVLMILDSKNIKYDVIDITEPGNEADKDFMQNNSKSNGGTVSDPNPRSPLPPQVFNDDEYCGDYDQFDMANEVDTLEQFLKVEAPPEEPLQNEMESNINGEANGKKSEKNSKENSQERESEVIKEETILTEVSGKEASSKEGSPEKNESKEPSPESEKPIEEDSAIEKEKSQEKDVETKEKTPELEESLNENGTASSPGHSEEKEKTTEVTEHKSDLSEALIENEKVAAAE